MDDENLFDELKNRPILVYVAEVKTEDGNTFTAVFGNKEDAAKFVLMVKKSCPIIGKAIDVSIIDASLYLNFNERVESDYFNMCL